MIGKKIYELRTCEKLSQEALAEKVNVSRQTISNWENNETVPDLYQAKELAKALNLNHIEDLFETNENFEDRTDIIFDVLDYWIKGKIIHRFKRIEDFDRLFGRFQWCSYYYGTITFWVESKEIIKELETYFNDSLISIINELLPVNKIEYTCKTTTIEE